MMKCTEKINIVEVVRQYIHLKPRGQSYIALCPFHEEKTPSFTVNSKKNRWKCFGCGRGGDAIAFIQELKGVGFPQALKILGIENNENRRSRTVIPPIPRKLNCLPQELVQKSMKNYEQNCFVEWLHSLFEPKLVKELITAFHIGTSSSFWPGSTVFWQVDGEFMIRQAKVMLYNSKTGNRRKWKNVEDASILSKTNQAWIRKRKPDVIFAGKMLLKKSGIPGTELRQCFFGEHQLSKDSASKIAIVESEKTVILMTAFHRLGLPIARDYIWLATGGKNGCSLTNADVTSVLEDRIVVLFPDLGAYEDWLVFSSQIPAQQTLVSTLIEEFATAEDKEKGLDIADFMLRAYSNGVYKPKLPSNANQKLFDTEQKPVQQPIKFPAILSRHEQILANMSDKNPLVKKLVQLFDLELE